MANATPTAPGAIPRHAIGFDAALLSKNLVAEERLFLEAWEYLPRVAGNISAMFQGALNTAGLRAVVDPDNALLRQDMLRAARSACAMADMVRQGIGPVHVDIGLGSSVDVARLSKNDVFNVVDLRRALFAAIIARDSASIEALCRVDPRSLRTPGSIVDDYAFTFAEFLQEMLTRSPDAGAKIVQAMAETDPAVLKTGNIDYALYIAVGEIDCFYGLSAPDGAMLNEKLAMALVNHRKFYDAEVTLGRSQRNDPRGFIALGPLAAAALAHDHGRSVTVKSDYLPDGLVDGRFVG